MLKCKKSFKSRPSVVPRPTCCLSAVLCRVGQSLARLCDFSERALFLIAMLFMLTEKNRMSQCLYRDDKFPCTQFFEFSSCCW